MSVISPARQLPAARNWLTRPRVNWLPLLFLLCALPTGLGLVLLTPIGQVADEPDHIARADGLLYGQIFGHRIIFNDPQETAPERVAGVSMNWQLARAAFWELEIDTPGHPVAALLLNAHPVTALRRQQAEALRWSAPMVPYFCENTIQYLPVFYLPGALGIGVSQLLGINPLQALYAGRLCMLAAYLLLGTLALHFARWGRAVLFTVLCLPESLSLGASFNQDGQIIAATTLFVALLTVDPLQRPKLRLAALAVFTAVLCCKPPYGLLMLAAAAPLSIKTLPRRLGWIAAFAIIPLIWVGVMAYVSLVPYHRAAYAPGPLWPGPGNLILHYTNAADNLRVLLAHPGEIWLLPVNYLQAHAAALFYSGIGMLGWMSIALPQWQYDGWTVAIATAILSCIAQRQRAWRTADAALVLLLIGLSVMAMELSLYLSWTNVGAAEIGGPMGRYFLLFIPFFILAVPGLGRQIDAKSGKTWGAGAVEGVLSLPGFAMAGLNIYVLPALIGRIFQTHL